MPVRRVVQHAEDSKLMIFVVSQKYGDAFVMRLAGQDITFITTASMISSVFRNSKDFTFTPFREEVLASAFGTSTVGTCHPAVDQEIYPVAARHFSKLHMGPCMTEFGKVLLDRLQQFRKSTSEQTEPMSLWRTVFELMYASHSIATFGPTFPLESTFEDYTKFDDGFSILAATRRLPSLLTKKYWRVRQRMIVVINSFVKMHWSDRSTVMEGASDVISEVTEIMKRSNFSDEDVSGHLLSFLWGTQANTAWSIFWFIAALSCNPDSARRLREEVDEFVQRRFAGDLNALIAAPSGVLDELPLLESGMRETLRLFSAFLIARVCTHDTILHPNGRPPLRIMEGEVVFSTPRNIHMDPEVYHNPDKFKLDRFLEQDGKTFRTVGDDGKAMQGNYVPWGGGENKVCFQVCSKIT